MSPQNDCQTFLEIGIFLVSTLYLLPKKLFRRFTLHFYKNLVTRFVEYNAINMCPTVFYFIVVFTIRKNQKVSRKKID